MIANESVALPGEKFNFDAEAIASIASSLAVTALLNEVRASPVSGAEDANGGTGEEETKRKWRDGIAGTRSGRRGKRES